MIDLHDALHGCCAHRRTGTAVIEAKLAQQLAYLELQPFYGVFLDLRKAFDAVDRDRCLLLLEGYGAGPRMIRLIRTYWRDAIMVSCFWQLRPTFQRWTQGYPGQPTFRQAVQHHG